MIGQFKGRQKTNVYGWVSDLAVARSGFNQIVFHRNKYLIKIQVFTLWTSYICADKFHVEKS